MLQTPVFDLQGWQQLCLFSSVSVIVEVSQIFTCCLSESKGKKNNTQKAWELLEEKDEYRHEKPSSTRVLCEGIIDGPCLPFISDFKSH